MSADVDPDRTPRTTPEILRALVAFDTTSDRPTASIIDWIEDHLATSGVRCSRSHGPEDGKWNLHAIIGPDRAGGIAFSGHVDCVTVAGQDWTSDPFTLREESGRLYGRGSADMKGFVAAMLAAVPDFQTIATQAPIHLFFTFDEEVTCDGARHLMKDVQARDRLPSVCIVGEPTMLQPVIAHKGRLAARLTFRGRSAHSSTPDSGVNAIHAMGRAIVAIETSAARFATAGHRAEGFKPPYTTTQAGLASGGQVLNIVPERATLEIEWRTVPGDDAHAELTALLEELAPVDAAMRHAHPECGIDHEVMCDLPPLALPETHALTDLIRQVTGANRTGHVSYGTEAGIYQRAGVPTIVCGPGDIAQAHKPDEWIARSQLDACDAFLRTVATRACCAGGLAA